MSHTLPPTRPESQWLYTLPPSSRLLFMGERNSSVYADLRLAASALSVPVELHSPSEVDLRLRTLPREQYAAIYWEQKNDLLPLEQAQRIFANVFQSLIPKEGKLIFSREAGQWDDIALESLLRQTGLNPQSRWTGGGEKLWICQRI